MRRGRKLRLRSSRVGVQGGGGVFCTLPGVTSLSCSALALLTAASEELALSCSAATAVA